MLFLHNIKADVVSFTLFVFIAFNMCFVAMGIVKVLTVLLLIDPVI